MREAPNQKDMCLLEISLLTAAATSVSDATQEEAGFLKRVQQKIQPIVAGWGQLLTCEAKFRQQVFQVMLTMSGVRDCNSREIWQCVENIKERVVPSRTGLLIENETQAPFYADLRNAFRGQFHECRDRNGHSSLDKLNVNLRINLFLSHYSKVTGRDRDRLGAAGNKRLPFYPYMVLLQSSGSGKSQLLRELGRTLPLVYGNLNPVESKGYPLSNKSLRAFLLFEDCPGLEASEVDSDKCEKDCNHLLIVAVIVFYLLFSHRGDERKLVTRPTEKCLRARVVDQGWTTAGIYEPEAEESCSRGDVFWNVVVVVTRRLLRRSDVHDSQAAVSDPAEAPKPSHELKELESALRLVGASLQSPRGTTHNRSEVWSGEREPVRSVAGNDLNRQLRSPAYGKVSDQVLRYIEIRTKILNESLADVGKSLQMDSSDMGSSKSVLYSLFVAFR